MFPAQRMAHLAGKAAAGFILALALVLPGCSAAEGFSQIDYGKSELYTREDLDQGIEMIEEAMKEWKGVDLQGIRYGSDEDSSPENIQWMNELYPAGGGYREVMRFYTDFHTQPDVSPSLNPDSDYTYSWWLARTDDGSWKILTFGQG